MWLVNAVNRLGSGLRAAEIVITGAAARLRGIRTGDVVSCEVDGVGAITTTVT